MAITALGGAPFFLPAQSDSTHLLPAVTIQAIRFERTGYAVWRADTLPLSGARSLSERLLWENPLSVRTTGIGVLSTVSARGMGGERTPVFWNGLNLQSPQHGVVDVALIPLWPTDQLEVRAGGQSAALSSGAMGGSVLIESQESLEQGWRGTFSGGLGSWGRQEATGAMGFRQENFSTAVRAAWKQADNDFPFQILTPTGPTTVRQPNNFQKNLDLQQHNRLRLNARNTLTTNLWWQDVFREIPPVSGAAVRETWQRDRALRAVATWDTRLSDRAHWQRRAAWLDERIRFRLAGDTDSSRARTALLSTEYAAQINRRWTWRAGASAQQQSGQADGYTDTVKIYRQVRLAGYGLGEWRWGQAGKLTALMRQEWAEGQGAPFTWSVGGQAGLGRRAVVRFHVSRNFHLPTFNDRFWATLGRPDLLPEKGHSSDIGLRWQDDARGWSAEASVFNLLIDNWILWQPDSLSGQFRPGNLRRVWSRGLELKGDYRWAGNDARPWQWKVGGLYQFCRATHAAVFDREQAALHRQLVYVPLHQGSLSLRVQRGWFSAAYLHQFTGMRYASADNQHRVKGFQVGTLMARGEVWQRRQTRLAVDVQLENCWNAAYEFFPFRPMPGRSWRVGLSISL